MASIYDWSTTASSNASADSAINWNEGQAPSTVNNSARQVMARIAEVLGDITGILTATGTANGLSVTANSSFTTYANGRLVAFRAAADNTSAATLNVNAIGAKPIRKVGATGDVALVGGEIQEDCIHVVVYNEDLNSATGGWQLLSRHDFVSGPASVTDGHAAVFDGTSGKTLKSAGDAPATLTGTETLTNKTLTSPTINGGTITSITDLAVADGGTGRSSHTAYAVLCGGTTSTGAQQSIAGVGSDGEVLTSNGAGALPTMQRMSMAPNAVLEDQKPAGTDGGTFTSGAWRTRDLNTEARDPDGLITVSSNQFTPSVDGWVEWSAPSYNVRAAQTRLFNVTDTTVVASGSVSRNFSDDLNGRSVVLSNGGAAVVAGKTYRIEHQCETTASTNGFGVAADMGETEVYTRVKFWRTA